MRRSIKTKNGRNRKNFIFFKKGKREKSKSISEMTISMVQSIHIPLLVIAIILLSFILCNNDNINIFKINSHSDIENIDEKIIEIGQKGKISSATIIDTSTGTGPWDENDDPGNDSSEDNNIVRSFDQVRWTVDLTMALKEETVESGLTGGVIEVDIQLSEQCANVVNWDLSSMNWLENGTVSDDGTRLTGKYSMTENETTIPGKQTLVFVLQVEGAENKTEIVPTFKFKLTGNNEEDKITITGEKVIVSAKGKYNIQLHSNTGNLSNKTTVDYGSGETEGRMYGYGFTVQLYNESSSKGLKGIEAFMEAIPNALNIACFDTAFHQTMDRATYLYPVLYDWYLKHAVRKYGFHGLSHKFITEQMSTILGKTPNLIICHIGSGASITAVEEGKSIDTSMGFTPNAGIMMGTRSGDIDYTIIPYIMKKENCTLEEVDQKLNHEGGLQGVAGMSDLRDIDEAYLKGEERVVLAIDMYTNKIVDYIAKYYVKLHGKVDAICFTAGGGENDPIIRSEVIKKLDALGITLDEEKNNQTVVRKGLEGVISGSDSAIPVYVLGTDEELMIARDTYHLVK